MDESMGRRHTVYALVFLFVVYVVEVAEHLDS